MKVLIANRGEIAVRVIRACRELGYPTVAVYSEPDRVALHVLYADQAMPIGPAPSCESYLRIDRIVDAAKKSGADAIHPGYGFLAENAVFAEKFVTAPRHIEVQVLGDQHGNLVHVGERECTLQRRHQKVLEECPSPVVDDDLREKLGAMAVRAAAAVNYYSAGTIECLMGPDKQFYFLEMNTRLQVEHPVTEMVWGIDLVKEQLRVARGERLSVRQKQLKPSGHAIECRIYAEDPSRKFAPSPGLIRYIDLPQGP